MSHMTGQQQQQSQSPKTMGLAMNLQQINWGCSYVFFSAILSYPNKSVQKSLHH
jgi:hypothetical protein